MLPPSAIVAVAARLHRGGADGITTVMLVLAATVRPPGSRSCRPWRW
ncbi:MAG: hypothetical protein IPN05_19785 [Sulfuritalea sp.]|nr:hypothetical protein [Sulfuritalea sp.]